MISFALSTMALVAPTTRPISLGRSRALRVEQPIALSGRSRIDSSLLTEVDDVYKIVGVTSSCPPSTIRAAFKRRAPALHPDLNAEPDAEFQFRRLVAAYEVISDPALRAAYGSHNAARASRPYAYRPSSSSEPERRPWMYEMAESKTIRILMAVGFVAGQYLSWFLFLYGLAHASVEATAARGAAGDVTTVCPLVWSVSTIGPC